MSKFRHMIEIKQGLYDELVKRDPSGNKSPQSYARDVLTKHVAQTPVYEGPTRVEPVRNPVPPPAHRTAVRPWRHTPIQVHRFGYNQNWSLSVKAVTEYELDLTNMDDRLLMFMHRGRLKHQVLYSRIRNGLKIMKRDEEFYLVPERFILSLYEKNR